MYSCATRVSFRLESGYLKLCALRGAERASCVWLSKFKAVQATIKAAVSCGSEGERLLEVVLSLVIRFDDFQDARAPKKVSDNEEVPFYKECTVFVHEGEEEWIPNATGQEVAPDSAWFRHHASQRTLITSVRRCRRDSQSRAARIG